MMIKRHLLTLAAAMMLPAALIAGVRELPLPSVPVSLKEPSERAAYIMLHFWDGMDWRDSALIADDSFMEQNSANFYTLFSHTDSINASKAVDAMLAGASVSDKAYRRVADIAALYLHEPDSPMIDDESYAVVVDRLLADNRLGEADRLRLEDAHRTLMRNRKGTKAADIAIITRDRTKIRLSDAVALHPVSILIFYDPDCLDCAELEEHLKSNIPEAAGVVMICAYDTDESLWKAHAATMPANWIVTRPADPGFENSEAYDIPVTPTVYLLDRNLTVLAKNLTLRTIDNAVQSAI